MENITYDWPTDTSISESYALSELARIRQICEERKSVNPSALPDPDPRLDDLEEAFVFCHNILYLSAHIYWVRLSFLWDISSDQGIVKYLVGRDAISTVLDLHSLTSSSRIQVVYFLLTTEKLY
jgi:hypothetical protein